MPTSLFVHPYVFVFVCVHLYAVLFRTPGVLDDSNSNKGSDTGQKDKQHYCYATLVAHWLLGGHFLLARNGVKKKDSVVLTKSILPLKVMTSEEV